MRVKVDAPPVLQGLTLYGVQKDGTPIERHDPYLFRDLGFGVFYFPDMETAEMGGLVACNGRGEERVCGEAWESPDWQGLPEAGGLLVGVFLVAVVAGLACVRRRAS